MRRIFKATLRVHPFYVYAKDPYPRLQPDTYGLWVVASDGAATMYPWASVCSVKYEWKTKDESDDEAPISRGQKATPHPR